MMHTSPQILLHLSTVVPALGLGMTQWLTTKGTRRHVLLGRVWVALMVITSLTSFFIQRAGLSWIHGLSVVTLVSVTAGAWHARHGNHAAHGKYMMGALLGSLGAGLGALAPGRLLHAVLFGG